MRMLLKQLQMELLLGTKVPGRLIQVYLVTSSLHSVGLTSLEDGVPGQMGCHELIDDNAGQHRIEYQGAEGREGVLYQQRQTNGNPGLW